MTRLYILYDSRAWSGNTDDAVVFCCANSLEEAIEDMEDFPGAVIYSYDVVGKHLVDERLEK